MADDDVRRAQRAWRESGSVEDEALYLRARVRSGELTTPRLELAAYVGHPAAQHALGLQSEERDDTDFDEIARWVRGLDRFGRPAVVRAAHAAAASVLPLWEGRPDTSCRHLGEGSPREQLVAVERWLACPCDAHRDGARQLINDVVGSDAVNSYGHLAWAYAHDAADDVAWSLGPGETTLDFLADSVAKIRDGARDRYPRRRSGCRDVG